MLLHIVNNIAWRGAGHMERVGLGVSERERGKDHGQ